MFQTRFTALLLVGTLVLSLVGNARGQGRPSQEDASQEDAAPRDTVSQSPSDAEDARIPAFLRPPPKELLQRGLQPLATELPDIRTRDGLLPPDASRGLFDQRVSGTDYHRGNHWVPQSVHWVPSGNRYRPLYFEDAMLERHGQTRHPLIQPLASGARFFATFPTLPYAAVVNRPDRPTSMLGHFRAGSDAPCLLQRPPLQADAGLLEASMVVGLIFIIP